MELRKPAACGCAQCQHRGSRQSSPARPPVRPNPPARAPAPVGRAAAAARPRQPAARPEDTAEPMQAAPVPQPPPQVQMKRAYLSAYAKEIAVTIEEGESKQALPLEAQRAEGGMALKGGLTAAPEDGYYMVLWELGVGTAQGKATLQLGINEALSQLTYALHPGYDSGQQVTWLSAGDTLGLFLQTQGDEKAEVLCTCAQFTVIRLG